MQTSFTSVLTTDLHMKCKQKENVINKIDNKKIGWLSELLQNLKTLKKFWLKYVLSFKTWAQIECSIWEYCCRKYSNYF